MRFVFDDGSQMMQLASTDNGLRIPFLDNALEAGKQHIQQFEYDQIVTPVTGTIEDIIRQLAIDFGRWFMHVIGPISLVVCTIFLLGIIMGVEKAPKRAMIWGIIASMSYGMEAAHE